MKEFDYIQEVFNINQYVLEKNKELLNKSIKTLNHTNTEEIKRVYELKISIDEFTKLQEKLTERLQILAEEEK